MASMYAITAAGHFKFHANDLSGISRQVASIISFPCWLRNGRTSFGAGSQAGSVSESITFIPLFMVWALISSKGVFGWQTVAASAPFLAGTLIQGLLVLTVENYVYERWHGTLLYWAILLVAVAINVLGSGILPLVKKLSMVFHVIGYIVVMVVICVVSSTKHSTDPIQRGLRNHGLLPGLARFDQHRLYNRVQCHCRTRCLRPAAVLSDAHLPSFRPSTDEMGASRLFWALVLQATGTCNQPDRYYFSVVHEHLPCFSALPTHDGYQHELCVRRVWCCLYL